MAFPATSFGSRKLSRLLRIAPPASNDCGLLARFLLCFRRHTTEQTSGMGLADRRSPFGGSKTTTRPRAAKAAVVLRFFLQCSSFWRCKGSGELGGSTLSVLGTRSSKESQLSPPPGALMVRRLGLGGDVRSDVLPLFFRRRTAGRGCGVRRWRNTLAASTPPPPSSVRPSGSSNGGASVGLC
nr:hypothetical protein Iba_chr02eCG7330 [Ipomoea batatas]